MKKEKPLPTPPTTPFGRKKPSEQHDDQGNLVADRMAAALAEGKLDEFLKQEIPDNDYARNLASMMMGMTGMMPSGGMPQAKAQEKPQAPESETSEGPAAGQEVPDDVRAAIQEGDVAGLMGILRREHQKRNPDAEAPEATAGKAEPVTAQSMPSIDKELIDALIQIARDNDVTLDWMILRAIKVYVQEYQKTGRL